MGARRFVPFIIIIIIIIIINEFHRDASLTKTSGPLNNGFNFDRTHIPQVTVTGNTVRNPAFRIWNF